MTKPKFKLFETKSFLRELFMGGFTILPITQSLKAGERLAISLLE